MGTTLLDDRRRGAEEAFFAKHNETLRVELRGAGGPPATKDELAAASGIGSDAVLDALVDLNVGAEGAAALSLIPLVVVAWADGEVSPKEREALLAAARDAGLDHGGSGYRLFAGWLDDHPPASLIARWKDYVAALRSDMEPQAHDAFRREIGEKARAVAAAAGGFLGMGRISAAEEAALADIEASLRV